jgi:serine protease Do
MHSYRATLALSSLMVWITSTDQGLTQIRLQSGNHPVSRNAANSAMAARDAQLDELAEEVSALERQVKLLRRVVSLVAPTVVHIESVKENSSQSGLATAKSETKRVEEAGAGVMVDIGGKIFVITNRHVVHPARLESIRIHLNDRTAMHPRRVLTDPSTDIAVLAIDTTGTIPARIGDSDAIEMGDFVLAVGSPFGLAHSVSYGIISAKGRRNLELGNKSIEIQDFIQTDAAINPGNSGGPLLNLRGEVVGINTAIASSSGGNEGIGFSIPINMVMAVARQLVEHGEMRRAYLGVQMDNAFDAEKARQYGLSQPVGALVKVVRPRSPAEQAGIRVHDIIMAFNGTPIDNDGHLVQQVGMASTQQEVEVRILREGRPMTLRVKLTALDSGS